MTTTTDCPGRSGRGGRARFGAVAAIACAAALAGCSSTSPSSSAGPAGSSGSAAVSASAVSLATSFSTAKESWAIVPMSANPVFWEVFVRPAPSASWQLVTPPGVADNGGLVAATDTASGLTVAVRPSQDLDFTPVTSTGDAGASWSADGPISRGVASSPGALAVSGRQLAALLGDGTIEASTDAGGTWGTLAKPGTIAASAAGRGCGTVRITSVAFGPIPTDVLAGGSCGPGGSVGVFSHSAGAGWQRLPLPVSGQLVRLESDAALVRSSAGLTAVWGKSGWYAYAPLSSAGSAPGASASDWTASAPLPVTSAVTASGDLAGATASSSSGTWVLLPGGQAATIAGPGQQWLLLPPVPAHTSVLASGPGTSLDALAVSGSTLTVWQLDHGSTVWAKAQTMNVPIQLGSSS